LVLNKCSNKGDTMFEFLWQQKRPQDAHDRIERCCRCDEPTGKAGEHEDSLFVYPMDGNPVGPLCDKCYDDTCGYCGEPDADKMALWTGGALYWPGEFTPEHGMVHRDCEREETRRAHAELSQEEIREILRAIK